MTDISVYYLDPANQPSSFHTTTGHSIDIAEEMLIIKYSYDGEKAKRGLLIPIKRVIEIRTKEVDV